jgi:hypothetical protein
MLGPFDNLTFGFGADDPKSHDAMMLRQRIALQMLSQKKGYPKNIGEGLTAIGDALGDRAAMASLERIQAGQDAKARAAAEKGETLPNQNRPPPTTTDPSTGGRRSEAVIPVDDTPPPVETADATPYSDATSVPPDALRVANQSMNMPPPAATQSAALNATAPYFPDPSQAPPNRLAMAQLPPPMAGQGTAGTATPWLNRTVNNMQAMGPPSDAGAADGPLNDAQSSQLASLIGPPGGRPAPPSYFPTASLGNGPVVPRPNPTLSAGSFPPVTASTFPDLAALGAGSPSESAGNRQIPFQVAQASPSAVSIKPSSAPSEPIPAPKAEPRYQTPQQFNRPGVWETPPRIAEPGQRQIYYDRLSKDPTYSPAEQAGFAERAAELERTRQEDFKQQTEAYKTRNEQVQAQDLADKAFKRNEAQRNLELQALEQKRQAAEYAERITRHLGGRDPTVIEAQLAKSQASVAAIPAIADSIQRVKNVVDKMYTGRSADAEEFLSQVMPGWVGFDPARGTATQQFKTAMTDIMAAHRAAVVGPGSQSGPELALLQKSTAADAKLNKDTIKESIDAAERLMVKTAIAHQNQVQLYSGNFDPDRTRNVYGSFGIPGMENIVPQRAVNNLFTYRDNEQALKDFDEKYHTPGLAQRILSTRKPQ